VKRKDKRRTHTEFIKPNPNVLSPTAHIALASAAGRLVL
jgi:hypothetical protein